MCSLQALGKWIWRLQCQVLGHQHRNPPLHMQRLAAHYSMQWVVAKVYAARKVCCLKRTWVRPISKSHCWHCVVFVPLMRWTMVYWWGGLWCTDGADYGVFVQCMNGINRSNSSPTVHVWCSKMILYITPKHHPTVPLLLHSPLCTHHVILLYCIQLYALSHFMP